MKLMALDGNSLAYRAFFALPTDMATASGQVTNSVYGFCTMLNTLVKDHKPDGVIVVFDRREKTFRHEAVPEYKAQREQQPDILYQQLEIIKELLSSFGIPVIDAAGFEGDDLIATIATQAEERGAELIVVTGDRDSYQLVKDPLIRVLYNKRGVSDYALYNEAGIFERTGVTPAQYPDYAALRGDPSDNLEGVPGVGEKTAAKLINQYGSLESIFDAADAQTPKLKESLHASRERVTRNAKIMVLRRDAPIGINVLESAPKPNIAALQKWFETLEFKSMLARTKDAFARFIPEALTLSVEHEVEQASAAVEVETTFAKSASDAVAAIDAADGSYGIVLAAGWLNEEQRSLDGIAVVVDHTQNRVVWIPALIAEDKAVLARFSTTSCISGHHVKPMLRWFLTRNIDIPKIGFDTAIAAYLLEPAQSKLEAHEVLARYTEDRIGARVDNSADDGQLSFDAQVSNASADASNIAVAVSRVIPALAREIGSQGVGELFNDVELPLVRVLAKMEHVGVLVDKQQLTTINEHLVRETKRLTVVLHELAGKSFNLNSPTQLRQILYEDKKLSPGKKTKTGFSTDAATLEKIRDQWPEFIDQLLEYREFEKLRGTYGQGLLDAVQTDGRIHATFNQTVARTGRLSSDAPNLHNIPIRSEEGKVFRTAFVPREGCVFMVADYNQIELRCIAHLADDPGLIDAFTRGIDIHSATAARVFAVDPASVTSDMRSQAKMISYGLAYGMEAFGLSQRLGVGVGEASEILDAYFAAFPNVKQYMDNTIEEARTKGYTETLFGRRRQIPELNNPNFRIRQAGERQAMNAGIQGLAADIFKIALVRIDTAIAKAKLQSSVILQVHDEVIVECPVAERDKVNEIVLYEMKNAASLKVPLEVNAAWGDSWASAKA
jgi:DNA polymerase-1